MGKSLLNFIDKPSQDNRKHKVQYDISAYALFKIAVAGLLLFAFYRLLTFGILIFLGCLLAVSLNPIVRKLRALGLSKGLSITIVTATITGLIGLVVFGLIPSIFDQVIILIKRFPNLQGDVLHNLADDNVVKTLFRHLIENTQIPPTDVLVQHTLSLVTVVFGGLSQVFLILIFSIYLLIDGKRAFKWICDFFSAPIRTKLQATAQETSVVVFGYVTGQIVTSLIGSIFSYAVLVILHVPGALTLACLAGLLDVLPILGFFLAVIPAVLLGFTVSPSTAVAVLSLYVMFHAVESYLIAPMVYGTSLKVSPLVVLVALLASAILFGIWGAIAVLPVVASYPIIERIWLVKYLGGHVVEKHADDSETSTVAEQVKVWNEKLLSASHLTANHADREIVKMLGKTILFMEDDPDIRSTLKEILETEGYTVIVASNGKDGLDLLQQNPHVGLILLDMQMPIMDGRTFLNNMPKAYLDKIPVVFLSANADDTNSSGAVGYLRKPAELNLVLETVNKHYHKSFN